MTTDPTTTIGLLHPGEMGTAVGAAARTAGARVIWCSDSRSAATLRRAGEDGLEDVHWLNGLVNQSAIVLSVCPPHAALEVAEDVAGLGFRGIYVDANAIAPETARQVAATVERSGATFVDGGIVGGPPRRAGTTRLYLSGEMAPKVARFFAGSPLETVTIDGGAGAASALKMVYAAWTKGTTALLSAIHAVALHEGVHEALIREWSGSQPELLARSDRGMASAAAKAWRWVGEMEEIARAFEAAGLPGGFHEAAAEVYRRLEPFKDDADAPGGAELARHLLHESGGR
ncbi:MAG: NAD(P)-dependent oxidoreductase [Chloroflexi bacterium]|nr:NAD(P)-dependent oxidoreductase [Chloroflexota bacterium]